MAGRLPRPGDAGLAVKPVSGRPAKLTPTQEKVALRWLTESPTHHGFETELWSAARLGQLIRNAVAAWLESDWPSIKKRPGGKAPASP